MRILKRTAPKVAAVGVALGVGLSGALFGASPAAAVPSNCFGEPNYTTPGDYRYGCTSGTGYYRAVAYCSNTPGGWGIYKYGPWYGVSYPLISVARCDSTYKYLVSGYGEKK